MGNDERDNKISETAGAINSQVNVGAENTQMERLHASQGHGFAAERANHLYDKLHGKEAVILGDNNAKNGADRMVDGSLIQSKYCQNAAKTVSEAFDNNGYRYLTPDGQPMQLEVPADQYEAAIEAMEKRIAKGEVPNVANPKKAKDIVRKGHFTYDQAQRLAKSNTVESLVYDAVNGTVVAVNAFGITATITFALSCWNGDDLRLAVENAVCAGVQVGGASFITNIAVSQLTRAGLNRTLVPATNTLVKVMGSKSASVVANAFRSNANIYGQAAMNNMAKLIRCNAISGVVMTVVLSSKDIGNAFQGRISGAQLFKNIATTAGGMAGGTAGMVIGTVIAGPVGGIIGTMVGGAAGGTATNAVAGCFIEDDAVRLTKIIEEAFCSCIEKNLLTAEETELVLTELSNMVTGEKLMEMNASSSQTGFAEELVSLAAEKIISFRSYISLPSDSQMLEGMQYISDDYENESGIFGSKSTLCPVEMGKQLTGINYSKNQAKRAMYAVKQINSVQKHTENKLVSMKQNEEITRSQLTRLSQFKN